MQTWTRAILTTALFLAFGALAADDEPVTVTTFQLKDGQKIDTFRYASMGARDLKSYVLYTLDGHKLIVLEKEITARKDEVIPLDKLPEVARKEVLKNRAALAAAQEEAEARGKEQEGIAEAKRKETDARVALKKINEEWALGRNVLTNAEKIIRDTPVEIAKLDAQYDAAKTELGGMSSGYSGPYIGYYVDHRRADYLRALMTRAAEDKVRLDQAKKEAQDIITRVTEANKVLEARVVIATKDLEIAQAEVQAQIQKMKDAAREREKARETKAAAAPQAPTPVTLKDGTVVNAVSIVEDPEGRATIKDDQGKIHYENIGDIVKRETK